MHTPHTCAYAHRFTPDLSRVAVDPAEADKRRHSYKRKDKAPTSGPGCQPEEEKEREEEESGPDFNLGGPTTKEAQSGFEPANPFFFSFSFCIALTRGSHLSMRPSG